MKGLMKSTLCLIAIVTTGIVQAHEFVQIQNMTTTSGTGYTAKKLVWHSDKYSGALPYRGQTNFGPWSLFPKKSSKIKPADAFVGPLILNSWYRVKWYIFVPLGWSQKVFAHADICAAINPPKRDR